MKAPIIALIAVILTLSPALSAADLDVNGLETPRDKIVAAKRLLDWVSSLGYKAVLSDDGEDVLVTDTKLTLNPRLSADKVDRIVVYNSYAGKIGNLDSQELNALIAKLNSRLNTVNIFVADQGSITFASSLAFDDTLTPRLLRLFMDHCNRAAELVIKANPELGKFIR